MAGPSPIVDEIQRAPDATHLGSSAVWVIERRRDPRVPVSWGVRWIIGEWIVIFDTRALDASTHGLRVEMPMKELGGLGELLVPGQRHRIEILLSGGRRLTRIAEVRHVADGSVGFLIDQSPGLLICCSTSQPAALTSAGWSSAMPESSSALAASAVSQTGDMQGCAIRCPVGISRRKSSTAWMPLAMPGWSAG